MTPQQRAAIEREIEALNVNYWYDVDREDGRGAHLFFLEDGIFSTSLRARQGHAAIAAFYAGRQSRGQPRTARHVIANLRVRVQDESHAEADWIMLLYAADGVPVLPSEPAIMIADVHDVCVRDEFGVWRYASRTIAAVFKSDTPTTG